MAALMRCARFCVTTGQIPKLLRVVSTGSSQTSVNLPFQHPSAAIQRSWLSTLAEGVEAEEPAPSTSTPKVEALMITVERYMRQFGRVSRKQLDPIVSTFDKEGTISLSSSLSLLRLHGTALFDEPPASRLKLAQALWEKYKKYDIPLEVGHYNALLGVYNQNKMDYSPTEFLADMEANGVTPNRVTYQRLIARFCNMGDIQGATQVLEHMKKAALPINDQVFNSFITGHLRSNDPESAQSIVEVMRQTGLEPTNTTYMTLAIGFAERGEIEEVKKYINQAEIENVPLRPGQLLEVYAALAMNGHNQYLKEIMTYLQNGTPYNQDAIRICNQLIAVGCDDAAYQLFLEMPKPTRIEAEQATLGRFFLRALARHQRPVEKVVEFVKDMQAREVNKDNISAVAQLAYLENQPAYALSFMEKMKAEGLPVRAHFFWPALCQFKEAKNKEGIYDTLEKMNRLADSRDDFNQTLHTYAIPGLAATGESEADILSKVQNYGFQEKEANFAYFLYLLDTNKLEKAIDFLKDHEVNVAMAAVRACLMSYMRRDVDWKPMFQLLAQLKSKSTVWRGTALETTAMVLKRALMLQRKDGWADANEIFAFLEANDMRILRRNQQELAEYFSGAPDDVLQKLNGLVSSDTAGDTDRGLAGPMSFDLSLEELKALVRQNPNNKGAQKRLLLKACGVGDVEEAEKVKSTLEAEGFVFPPQVLGQLAYMYAMFVKDVEKAQHFIQELETTFPEHKNYQAAVLKLAALQVSQGQTDAAVDALKRYADRHKDIVEKQSIPKPQYFSDIVSAAADADAAKKLMDTLFECGYVPRDSIPVLDSYMDKLVDSGDSDRILAEFEEFVKTQRRSPKVDKVLQFFINKEDPDRLQKVVDVLTELYGLMNVFHHLIADFIECGHIKKARKIMETPGLRANMQRLNYYCQSFIERNMIKELEALAEVTKEMFGIDRDNMLFHLIRGYVNQKDFERAKDVLVQYEEEMLAPSARTLRFLARNLETAGLPVSFEVPDYQPPVQMEEKGPATKRKETPKSTVSQAAATAAFSQAGQLKDSIEKGEVEKVLADLQGSEKGALAAAVTQLKRPWPIEALESIFESLAKQGDLDTLKELSMNRLPVFLRNSLKANIFAAAVNSGRTEEVLDDIETVKTNTGKYFTFSSLDTLHSKTPELMDRVESIGKNLISEKNYTEPLSVLWCYYKYRNSPRAEELMNEIPGLDKSVLVGALCDVAVEEKKADVLESLLKMKKDLDEKQGTAFVYSSLLQLHVNQGDADALEKTCESIVKDGIARASIRKSSVKAAENLLTEKNKPLPAWAEESSDSDSSSSSDEEKESKR
ncbi:leucine-rich PPR motif-containing protein, mitochondrial-like [Littorina saxatilis]|uniref:PROP1-like PPR domain-containing protein n=1 Tax=Littorina saxatilis TaxID=31220 RepID=A0AAN9GES0_9CAEN